MMEKKKNINKKEFKEFITGLVDRFDDEHLESPLFKHFFENYKYFSNPSEFETMVVYPLKKAIELVLVKKENKSKEVASLYWNYDFLENNVSELCSKLYGSACSVDKGRFLVKSYIRLKETGKIPEFNWKGEYVFHYPKTGTEKQWMSFIEGVDRLQYGYNKEYLLALKKLINAKKTKIVKEREKRDLKEYYRKYPDRKPKQKGGREE